MGDCVWEVVFNLIGLVDDMFVFDLFVGLGVLGFEVLF